ncbi:hypothetical protein REPUB_Repub12eG0019700 [Reevesia pubescens]
MGEAFEEIQCHGIEDGHTQILLQIIIMGILLLVCDRLYKPKNNFLAYKDPICASFYSPKAPQCKNPNEKCGIQVDYVVSASIVDEDGHVLLVAVTKTRHHGRPLHAKAKEISFGLKLEVEVGFMSFLVEIDALMAIVELNKTDLFLWDGAPLIKDIKEMASSCDMCSFVHARRSANMLAHALARVECF